MKLNRWHIINWIIEVKGYATYLEIGLNKGLNFKKIKCAHKVSVDPLDENSKPTHKMTSDEFFEQNDEIFDIVFVDGLHHADQVYKDIMDSLECLSADGSIVCHDMNPRNRKAQLIPRKTRAWCGDCWKAFVRLRTERDDLSMCVINADCGMGIIQRGIQEKLLVEPNVYEEYNNFVTNKKKWLNLVSFNEFKNKNMK